MGPNRAQLCKYSFLFPTLLHAFHLHFPFSFLALDFSFYTPLDRHSKRGSCRVLQTCGVLTPSPCVTDSLTRFSWSRWPCFILPSGLCGVSFPSLGINTHCWRLFCFVSAPPSRLYLDFISGWKSRERQLATLLGTVIDLLLVHSLCESILALVCLFLGVLFTALHSYLFCIASYVRLYFPASGYWLDCSGFSLVGGMLLWGKRPSTQAMRCHLGNLGLEWAMTATGRGPTSAVIVPRAVEVQMGYYHHTRLLLRW